MDDSIATYVILLRAIGPATHRLMRMAHWRDAALNAGFIGAETLGNTGNMIAGFKGDAGAAHQAMVPILRSFGLGDNVVPVVRTAAEVQRLEAENPLCDAASNRPSQTAVFFLAADRPDFGWLANLDGPEQVHVLTNHLIVDFIEGIAQAGRLIRQIDKNCGLNTARNWSTCRKLAQRCAALTSPD